MEGVQLIPCMIWRNDVFPFLSTDLKLVWFHLMTTPLGSPLGIVHASTKSLTSELRRSTAWYRKRLNAGMEAGLWKYDKQNQVVCFLDYWTQTGNKPETPKVLDSWLKYLGDSPIAACFRVPE